MRGLLAPAKVTETTPTHLKYGDEDGSHDVSLLTQVTPVQVRAVHEGLQTQLTTEPKKKKIIIIIITNT